MTRLSLRPDGYGAPLAPYSAVVVAGDLVFVSGQVPLDPKGQLVAGGFREQAVQVHDNLVACLSAADCSMNDVLKATVYLVREADFDEFNAMYVEWFASPLPARTAVRCDLMRGFLVEVDVIARRPG